MKNEPFQLFTASNIVDDLFDDLCDIGESWSEEYKGDPNAYPTLNDLIEGLGNWMVR